MTRVRYVGEGWVFVGSLWCMPKTGREKKKKKATWRVLPEGERTWESLHGIPVVRFLKGRPGKRKRKRKKEGNERKKEGREEGWKYLVIFIVWGSCGRHIRDLVQISWWLPGNESSGKFNMAPTRGRSRVDKLDKLITD